MKICIVIVDNSFGGSVKIAKFVYDLLINQHKISVISLRQNKSGFFDETGFICMEKGERKSTKIARISETFFGMRKYFKKNKFDLIIGFAGVYNYAIPILTKDKFIISTHMTHHIYSWLVNNTLVKYAHNKAKYVTFLTESDKKFYNLPHSKAVNNPCFFNNIDDENVEKENIILFPSMISPRKRLNFLLDAFRKIKNPLDYKIVVYGENHEDIDYISKYSDLPLEINPPTNNIAHQYKRAKIVALTSTSEGLPNILIESMFFDCARISTDCSDGVKVLIDDGKNGFISGVDNVDEFAKKLEILMHDDKTRANLIKNARELKPKFEPENIAKEWLEIVRIASEN